jgi:hypothetical protein
VQKATGRIELPTLGLQDQCSATELSRPSNWEEKATERIELSTPGLRDLCSATELSSHVQQSDRGRTRTCNRWIRGHCAVVIIAQ